MFKNIRKGIEKMRKFYLQFKPQVFNNNKVIGFYPAKGTKTWVLFTDY